MKTGFRKTVREYGLTYSQCTVTPAEMQEFFWRHFSNKIKYSFVVQEEHEDHSPHLHAVIQFKEKYKVSERTFDYPLPDNKSFHPKIEGVNDSKNWLNYMRKTIDVLPPLIPNDRWVEKGEFTVIRELKKKKKLTNLELINASNSELKAFIDSDKLSLFSLMGVKRARMEYEKLCEPELKPLAEFLPPFWKDIELPIYPPWNVLTKTGTKKRHYWLYSPQASKGKTSFMQLIQSIYLCSFFTCSEVFQDVKPNSQFLLFDEYGKGNSIKATVMDLICDGNYLFPVKGGTPVLLKSPIVIIGSNKRIDEVYNDYTIIDKISARFNLIDLTNSEFI